MRVASSSKCALLGVLMVVVGEAGCSGALQPASEGFGDAGGASASDAGVEGGYVDGATFADAGRARGCTEAEFAADDRTAAGAERVVRVATSPDPVPFVPRCLRIRVGQTVAWEGDLGDHPLKVNLAASSRGQIGSADGAPDFMSITPGGPGVIDFECTAHPTLEYGAVEVVP